MCCEGPSEVRFGPVRLPFEHGREGDGRAVMFASKSLTERLVRGLVGVTALVGAVPVMLHDPLWSMPLGLAGVLRLRGCPTRWMGGSGRDGDGEVDREGLPGRLPHLGRPAPGRSHVRPRIGRPSGGRAPNVRSPGRCNVQPSGQCDPPTLKSAAFWPGTAPAPLLVVATREKLK